mmetsp:Transcript_23606/g.82182  ORF Transcript_23606/g.82182 Transcript_23606/m.82182 type:complete len:259 (+) Transcript_23606:263-1039(+)
MLATGSVPGSTRSLGAKRSCTCVRATPPARPPSATSFVSASTSQCASESGEESDTSYSPPSRSANSKKRVKPSERVAMGWSRSPGTVTCTSRPSASALSPSMSTVPVSANVRRLRRKPTNSRPRTSSAPVAAMVTLRLSGSVRSSAAPPAPLDDASATVISYVEPGCRPRTRNSPSASVVAVSGALPAAVAVTVRPASGAPLSERTRPNAENATRLAVKTAVACSPSSTVTSADDGSKRYSLSSGRMKYEPGKSDGKV